MNGSSKSISLELLPLSTVILPSIFNALLKVTTELPDFLPPPSINALPKPPSFFNPTSVSALENGIGFEPGLAMKSCCTFSPNNVLPDAPPRAPPPQAPKAPPIRAPIAVPIIGTALPIAAPAAAPARDCWRGRS